MESVRKSRDLTDRSKGDGAHPALMASNAARYNGGGGQLCGLKRSIRGQDQSRRLAGKAAREGPPAWRASGRSLGGKSGSLVINAVTVSGGGSDHPTFSNGSPGHRPWTAANANARPDAGTAADLIHRRRIERPEEAEVLRAGKTPGNSARSGSRRAPGKTPHNSGPADRQTDPEACHMIDTRTFPGGCAVAIPLSHHRSRRRFGGSGGDRCKRSVDSSRQVLAARADLVELECSGARCSTAWQPAADAGQRRASAIPLPARSASWGGPVRDNENQLEQPTEEWTRARRRDADDRYGGGSAKAVAHWPSGGAVGSLGRLATRPSSYKDL